MRHPVFRAFMLMALVAALFCGWGGTAPARAATTVILGRGVVGLTGAAASSAEHYTGTGAWNSNNAVVEFYIDPTAAPYNLGSLTVSQVESVLYHTKNGATASVDFGFYIYTLGTNHGWYEERLTAEPLYSNSYNAPANQWNTWTTAAGENQLVFYDSNYTAPGFYNGPTLADLKAGPITWSDYNGAYATPIDYGAQTVKFFKFGTGSSWASSFNGYLDTITIELTTGDSVVIDLEDYLPVVYVDDDWTGVTMGEDPDGTGPAQIFGSDAFSTIQEGIAAVAEGGTVNVAAGTYLENPVALDKPLILKGASRSEVVIGPQAADTGDGHSSTDGTPQTGIIISASDVTVRDLTIDGQANPLLTGNNFRHGIYHYESPSPNLTGILIQDVNVYHTIRRGISIGQTNNPVTVTGCLVDDVTYMHAIRVDSAKAVVTNNTVRGAAQGISIGPGTSNPDPNAMVTVTGNTIENFGHLFDSSVYGNVAIYYRNPNDDRKVVIKDNTISAAAIANTAVGLYIYNANADSIIEGNTIDLSALDYTTEDLFWGHPYGIYLGGCAGTTVRENAITMSRRGSGIYLGRGSNTVPVPNIVTRNTISTSGAVSDALGESCGVSSSSDPAFDIIGEGQFNTNNTISNNIISGFVRGILLHEGDTYNVEATIYDNSITGSGLYAVDASTLTRTMGDASANWWGTSTAVGVASQVSAHVDYTPWLESATDTSSDAGFQGDFATLRVDDDSPQVGAAGRIQEGIDLVSASTVYVEPGLYTERIVITKSLTLLGATHDVNKNGYTVPVDYAWDTSVESVIDYPDPTGLAQSLSQLVDVRSDDVTVKGFVVQVLNARCAYNGDNLFRVDAGITGGAGTTLSNIVIENNVLGPATNTALQDGTCGRMGLYLASPTYPADRQGITNSRIAGNTIFGAEGNGNNIFIWGAAESYNSLQNADYSGTVIEDNDIYGSHRSGIEIAGGITGLTIRNNKVHDNSSTNGGTVDPNLKYGNGILLIRMGTDKTFLNGLGADGLTITDNEIYDNEKNGIYLGPVNSNHVITGNAILDNGLDGLRVDLTEAYHAGVTPVYTATLNISANENELQGNGAYGAQVIGVPANGFVLDAQRNWWGAADGPGGVGPGSGNAVSAYVHYCPWLSAAGGSPAGPDGRLITNLSTGEAFCTIQGAIDDADTADGHILNITAGTYEEDVVLNKSLTLQGAGVDATILQGDGDGAGIQIPYSGQPFDGITIADLKLTHYQDGMLLLGTTSNLLVEDVATVSNTRHGIWSQAWNVAHWTFRRVNASDNDNDTVNDYGRGLWIINGEKTDLTVVDSTFNNNRIAGLDVSDGNVTGLTITGNTVTNNGDAGIGALGMQGPLANRIADNTVTDNGRFGIEIKIPNGSGLDSGAGSIVVEDNQVSLTSTPTDLRDFAGIAAFRRSVDSELNVDVPTGVVIRNNTVSGYQQSNAASVSEGFGIVVEGTKMTVYGNTVQSCDVGIQQQAGHQPYPGDGDQSNLDDEYFGRGNSPVACAYIHDNTITDADVTTRSVGAAGNPTIENADTGNLFCSIQSAIDDPTTLDGHTINVPAGVYTEDLEIDKSVTLLGPNHDINPNTGTRVAEAVLHPATSLPDPNTDCTVMAYLSTSDVAIKGFTFDGDNPLLTSGIMIGDADVDVCEILAGYEGMGNITVENNILKNSTYSGIDFYNYVDSTATSGNYIRFNRFEGIGETTYNWGTGVLIYNNFYADITDNVFTGVRIGIQTGNFSAANPGTTGSISNNEIGAWRLGIFHNLWYGSASPLTISDNTITAEPHSGVTKWDGMLLASLGGTVGATISGNEIIIPDTISFDAPGYAVGINVWNVTSTTPITLTGGTVTGGDYGVFVNNYEGYSSNGGNTAIGLDGVTIQSAGIAGLYVKDSPDNTNGATVDATILGSSIMSSTVGVLIEGSDAAATGSFNRIVDNTEGATNTSGTIVNFENNWWGCNGGPGEPGCDTISTDVDADPWLVLGLTADPLTGLAGGDTSTLEASLRENSDGVDTSTLGYLPDGIATVFTATLGTVSPEQVGMAQGLATALFTTSPVGGNATVSARVDNQIVFLSFGVEATEFKTYLPLISCNHSAAPDLVVESVTVVDGDIRVVIANEGDTAATDHFWVDLYVSPSLTPRSVNETWDQVGDQGLVWGVTTAVGAGESITLTTVNNPYYLPAKSYLAGDIPADAELYAQVDSANTATTYGGVLEIHEIQGDVYNNIVGPVKVTARLDASVIYPEEGGNAEVAAISTLPTRP